MTVHQKFVADMGAAGIVTAVYMGRFFWEGPAARSDQRNGPTLQTIIDKTNVPLQWDTLNSDYVVYPVGRAKAEWNSNVADSEDSSDEQDGYTRGYVTTKSQDEEEED